MGIVTFQVQKKPPHAQVPDFCNAIFQLTRKTGSGQLN